MARLFAAAAVLALAPLATVGQLAPIKYTLDGSCGPGVRTISGIEAECDPTGDTPCCR